VYTFANRTRGVCARTNTTGVAISRKKSVKHHIIVITATGVRIVHPFPCTCSQPGLAIKTSHTIRFTLSRHSDFYHMDCSVVTLCWLRPRPDIGAPGVCCRFSTCCYFGNRKPSKGKLRPNSALLPITSPRIARLSSNLVPSFITSQAIRCKGSRPKVKRRSQCKYCISSKNAIIRQWIGSVISHMAWRRN